METYKKGNALFDRMSFIISAREEKFNPNREWDSHIHVMSDGTTFCSDGKRLHFLDSSSLTEGSYSIIKSNKTTIIINKLDEADSYPNIKNVIPKTAGRECYNILLYLADENQFDLVYCEFASKIAAKRGFRLGGG